MLYKKMLRDIKLNLSGFITIFLMTLIGVMVYSGIESYMLGMSITADNFYEEYNLQDLNVIGANFTEEDLETIKNIDNVLDVERKLTLTGLTDNDNTMQLNFIETNNISKFYIVDGVSFSVDINGLWLDNFYAEANNLKVGDTISITYDGYTFEESIVGLMNVPDHVYDVKDESEIYSDHATYGFAYLSTNELEGYINNLVSSELGVSEDELFESDFNFQNELIFNYLMVDVDEKDNVSSVKDAIEDVIEKEVAVIKIEDTASYSTYQGEIDEGKTYVGVFSGLFIFIAMLSVITTMTRVVKKQRMQIGTLKALGFKDSKIVLHYISYGFIVSILASIFGLILGYYGIGKLFISMEMSFFQIPNGSPVMALSSYICAILVVLGISLITYLACKNILKENAADTLKMEVLKVKNSNLNITTKGIFKKMSFKTKWNIRDMLRNKLRTITGIVGVMCSGMLIVCAIGMLDSMNHFIKMQFEDVYNFDYKLSLMGNLIDEDIEELTNTYGNNTSASFLIEFLDNEGSKISNNIFVTDAGDYVRFLDNKDNFITLDSRKGVYITYKLASTYNYSVGDTITWHIIGSDNYFTSLIVGFNKDAQNQNMTMTKEYYESLGFTYTPDTIYTNTDLSNTSTIKNIELIQDKNALAESMNNMLSMMKTMIFLIIGIAVILGAIIIYNMTILSYTEKQLEFSTLKVLGFSDKLIKKIFTRQNDIIAIISIILGLPLGYLLTDYLFKVAIDESYDFRAYINVETYIIAAIGTLVISYIVSKILARKINDIDMVSSLKSNE